MNLSNEPLLITSAEVALVETNPLISREGQRIPAMSYQPHDNEPVLIPPGQKRLINIRIGIRLDGLIPLINSLSVNDQVYSKVKIGNVNTYVVNRISLSDRFNDQIALLYGKDASLEVMLYVGLKKPVLSHRIYLSEGGDMFDNSGNVDWTRFLGELASIKSAR